MKISRITSSEPTYPELLKEIASPPGELFTLGSVRTDIPLVAIVGTRKATRYGREVTERLAFDLAKNGVGIISGLALGIDGIAHRAALEAGGYTLAVMACGLDRIYPASHRDLARNILANKGGIISEYESGTPPLKQHFPARNRIVAGIGQATVVTEAAEKSGALITATFALESDREVMAVPGNITNPLSQGTNNLIKAGATLVTSADDVLSELGITTRETPAVSEPDSAEEAALMRELQAGACDSDTLLEATGIDTATFNQTMTLMEISGKVRRIGQDTWIQT